MSLNVLITPDLDDEEEVEERTEDDEEEEFCNLASVRTRILPSLALRKLAQKS
jgi:dGTP triphosphohydrolase